MEEETREVAAAPERVGQRRRELREPVEEWRPTQRHFVKIVALVVSRGPHWLGASVARNCCLTQTVPAAVIAAGSAWLSFFQHTWGRPFGPAASWRRSGGRREHADSRLSPGVARAFLHFAVAPLEVCGKWAAMEVGQRHGKILVGQGQVGQAGGNGSGCNGKF